MSKAITPAQPASQEVEYNPIVYGTYIQINNDNKTDIKQIGWDEIDNYKFSNGFIEVITKPEYVHLYFDFDSIKTADEWLDVMDWLIALAPTFGKPSVGGYTNNKDVSESTGLKYIEGDKHFISVHVVYYESRIASKDLIAIMKHGKNGFIADGVHPLCDPNVYKLESTQKFRHVLSNKLMKKYRTEADKMNAGTIMGDYKPHTQIVQTKGNEPIITKEMWSEHFHIPEAAEAKQIIKEKQQEKKAENSAADFKLVEGMNDLNCNDKLIILSKEELLELLREQSHFEFLLNFHKF